MDLNNSANHVGRMQNFKNKFKLKRKEKDIEVIEEESEIIEDDFEDEFQTEKVKLSQTVDFSNFNFNKYEDISTNKSSNSVESTGKIQKIVQ
jgi:hypothetical protein